MIVPREISYCDGAKNKGHLERLIQITSSMKARTSEDIKPGSLDIQNKNEGIRQGSVAKEIILWLENRLLCPIVTI